METKTEMDPLAEKNRNHSWGTAEGTGQPPAFGDNARGCPVLGVSQGRARFLKSGGRERRGVSHTAHRYGQTDSQSLDRISEARVCQQNALNL